MQRKEKRFIAILSFVLIMLTTFAYSALATSLSITGEANFRTPADIRVTNIQMTEQTGATLSYEPKFTKDTITAGFNLASSSSTISYSVTITNSGLQDYAIYDLITQSSNNSGLSILIDGEPLNAALPIAVPFGTSKTITITYSSSTPGNVDVINKFDFRKMYYVTFDKQGGSSNDDDLNNNHDIAGRSYGQIKYENVNLTLSNSEPTKSGYIFTGWNTKSDGTGTNYAKGSTFTENSNKILYAMWERSTYTITFDSHNGEEATTKEVVAGDPVGTLSTPTKDGYQFNGWFTAETSGTQITSSTVPDSDKTYHAQWTANTITINYYAGGATKNGNTTLSNQLLRTNTYNYDGTDLSQYGLPNYDNTGTWNLKKDGYHADKYWHLNNNTSNTKAHEDSSFATTQAFADTMGKLNDFKTGNITVNVYAGWVANNYTLHFDKNDSNATGTMSNQTLTYDAPEVNRKINKNIFTKAGYSFAGWNTEANGTGTPYTDEQVINLVVDHNATVNLYAQWIDDIAPSNLQITNSSNGNWTNQNVVVTVSATEEGTGIKRFEWFENGAWTTRALTTTNNSATITYTADRDLTLRFRAIDNANNISNEITTPVRIDTVTPTATASNISYGSILTANLKDSDSGVSYWQVTTSSTTPTTGWEEITNSKDTNVSKSNLAVGTYYVWAKDAAGNISPGKQVTVSKQKLGPINNLSVTPAGIVTWNSVTNADGYQISIDGTNWTTVLPTANSGYNYLSTITAATGSRTIHVRAINTDTGSYETSDESSISVSVLTFTTTVNNANYGLVTNSTGNVISGATYSVSGSVLTIKGGTTTLRTSSAGAKDAVGYTTSFSNWTSTSGTITTDTTVTANFTRVANSYTVTANSNGGTIASTTGWTGTGNTSTKSVTYNGTYGTLPSISKTGYDLNGWLLHESNILPSGYTQLEYIESTGTQYIDSGYKPKANTVVEADYQFTATTQQQRLFGISSNASIADTLSYDFYISSGNVYSWAYQNNMGNWSWTSVYIDTNKHYLKFDGANKQIIVDDYTGNLISTTTNSSNVNLPIFARYSLDNNTFDNYAKVKLYSMKIYEGTTLKRNFIPCINNSTGKAGLYDLVTNTFYGNANNSGNDFTTANQEYITSSTVVKTAKNHDIYASWSPTNYTISYNLNNGYAGEHCADEGSTCSFSGTKEVCYGANSSYICKEATTSIACTSNGFGSDPASGIRKHCYVKATNPTNYNIESNKITLSKATKLGYTFKGWSGTGLTGDSNTTVEIPTGSTGNRSYTANYTANTYTLTLNPNGGTYNNSTSNSTKTMTYDSTNNNSIGVPTREGYTFNGWYTAATGGTLLYNTSGQNTGYYTAFWSAAYPNGVWKYNGAATVYAQWTPNDYTVTANANGGSIPSTTGWTGIGNTSTKSVTYDAAYGTLPSPTRSGYTFDTWTKENLLDEDEILLDISGATKTNGYYRFPTGNAWSIYKDGIDSITLDPNKQYTLSFAGYFEEDKPAGLCIGFKYVNGTENYACMDSRTYKKYTWTSTSNVSKVFMTYHSGSTTNLAYLRLMEGTEAEITSSTIVKDSDNHDIYAQWLPNNYTVTANANGGSIASTTGWTGTGDTATKSISFDETYRSLPQPTKTGYTFGGWYLNLTKTNTFYDDRAIASSNGQNIDNYSGYIGTKDFLSLNNIEKLYSNIPITMFVYDTDKTYIPGGMAVSSSGRTITSNYKYAKFEKRKEDEKDYDYYMDNLIVSDYSAASNISYVNDEITSSMTNKVDSNHTVFAKWTPNTYKVKFNANNGSGTMSDQSFTYDEAAKALTTNAFTRTGYVFAGWNTQANGQGTAYTNGQSVSNLTSTANGTFNLYAQWIPKQLTVVFNKNDGTNTTSQTTYTYDGNMNDDNFTPASGMNSRTGYTFAGWSLKADGSDNIRYPYTDMVGETWFLNQVGNSQSKTVNLYAQWTINSHTLTINPNGGSYNNTTSNTTITQNYNTTTTVLNNPTRAGYIFGGWQLTSGDGDITYFEDSDKVNQYIINSSTANTPGIYNNSNNGTVTKQIVSDSTSSTGYSLKLQTNGTASPNAGGFVNSVNSEASKIYYHKVIAKIPTGYNYYMASNSMGVGYGGYYIGSQAGTNNFKEYLYVQYSGANGPFSNFGHVYLHGSNDTNVTWNLQESTIYQPDDLTFKFLDSDATLTALWATSGSNITFNYQNGSQGTGSLTGTWAKNNNTFRYQTAYTGTKYAPYYVDSSDNLIYRDGYTFGGFYTQADGGTKLFDTDGSMLASVSPYTNASKVWSYYDSSFTTYAKWTKAASNLTVTLGTSSYTYDGNAKTPTVTVKDGTTTIPSSEYTVSYSNNTNAGTATATVTMKGNYYSGTKAYYTGSTTANYTINKKALTVTADNKSRDYKSSATQTYSYTVSGAVSGESPVSGTATYTVKNGSGTTVTVNSSLSAGTYTIIPSGLTINSNYNVTYVNGTLTVNKLSATASNVNVSTSGVVTWTGSNATSYQISIDGTNWTNTLETDKSGYNYLSTITAATGTRTVYVKAVNTDTTNYNNQTTAASKAVTVVTLTINRNNNDYGTVNNSSFKVISGSTITASSNVLSLSDGRSSTASTTALTGYTTTFSKWTQDTTSGTQITSTAVSISSNKTVYANFARSANTYTVTYNGNTNTGGSTATSTHTYDTAKNLTANGFTKTGYTFTGWSTSSSDKNLIYDNNEYSYDNTSGSSYYNIKQFDVAPPFASGEVYQLEVDAKGTGNLSNFFHGGTGYLRIASVTDATGQTYTNGYSDGYNNIPITSTYSHFTIRFTLGSDGDGSVVKKVLFRAQPGCSASFKNVRFYKVSSSSTTYVDEQSVINLATSGNVNLYAIWRDITAPTKPTVTLSYADNSGAYTSGTWTNKQVVTTISSTEEGSGITYIPYNYSGSWVNGSTVTQSGSTYSKTEAWTVTDGRNINIKFKAKDAAGNESAESNSVNIKYDISKPTITASNITYGSDLTANLKDTYSGVSYWQVTTSSTQPTTGWEAITNNTNANVSKSGLTQGTYYIWAKDAAGNISDGKQITVSKQKVNSISNLAVSSTGSVTWDTVANATGYQISIDGTNWTNVVKTANTGYNYLSTITAVAGSRTVRVRAVNTDTTNYETGDDTSLTVSVLTLTINATNGTVSTSSVKVISGASYTTSSNVLTVTGYGVTSTATKTDASGYTTAFSSWSSASGTITTDTTVTANFTRTGIVYKVTLNNQSATTSGTTEYYYRYKTTKTIAGKTVYYFEDQALTTPLNDGTYSGNENGVFITKPTKNGYTFKGYFTGTNGSGTQYINESGYTINSVYNTIGDKTLYAEWVDDIAPTIVSATPSSTLDLSNYVDFNATDAGSGVKYYNITTTNTAPTNWIPVISDVETTTETKYELDAAWARVFHHNNHRGSVLYKTTDVQSSNTVDKYSVLENIANYKNSNNWEFMLQYPDVSSTGYNRWTQTSNPIDTNNSVTGYTPIGTPTWPGSGFGGISLSSYSGTYMDATPNNANWWYAIGSYQAYAAGIPGPYIVIGTVNLWSRIDNLNTTTSANLTRRIGDIKSNGTYYIWIKDAAGNKSSQAVTINKVDNTVPNTATITSTNDVAASQTATLTMGDAVGLNKYYFGTSIPTNVSGGTIPFTSITGTSNSTTATVNNNGTYYLAVVDAAGNMTVSNKTFYKTTLVPNKGSVSPSSVVTLNGNSFTLPTPGSVSGYTWGGWYTDEELTTPVTLSGGKYTPSANATLYGKWTANTYTVTYNGNGAVNGSTEQSTHTYDVAKALTSNGFTRVGYTFAGWNTKADGTGTNYTNGQSVTNLATSGNVNLYAKWTKNNYTLTFDANGGSVSTSSKSVTYGTTYNDLPTPTKTGYTFKGWYADLTTSTSDFINYGREYMYTDKISIHTSAYMDNWANYGDSRIISSTESGGWNIEPSSGNINFAMLDASIGYKSATSSTAFSSLSAGWHDFDMVFDGNYLYGYLDGVKIATSAKYSSGAIGYNPTNSIFIGGEATSSATTPSGSNFNGYIGNIIIKNDDTLIAGTTYNTITAPAQDLTLKARWEANTYTVTYDGNGATSGSTAQSTHTYNAAKNLTSNGFSRTGYTFAGWNTKADGTGTPYLNNESVTNLATSGNVTLYAQWLAHRLTVRLYSNGAIKNSSGTIVNELFETNTYDYDQVLSYNWPSDYYDPYGYKLVKPGYNPTSRYHVGSPTSSTVIAVDQVKDNATTAANIAETLGVLSQLNAGDTTVDLYAGWSEKTYSLTVKPNGGTYNSKTTDTVYNLNYSDVQNIVNPTRTGYQFAGWNELSGAKYTNGLSSVSVYNNNGGSTVTVTSQAKSNDNPLTGMSNELVVTNSGASAASPGLGGFYHGVTCAASKKYTHVFVAKLPSGYYFHNANNSLGTGGSTQWLTSNEGTGNFETYAYQVNCGSSGSFSTFGHVYVSTNPRRVWGNHASETGAYTAYLAYSNIYDITDNQNGIGQYDGTGVLTANWTANELTFNDKTVTSTFNASNDQTITNGVDQASNGTGTYTYAITGGNSNNYFSLSGRNIVVAANTPANTTGYNVTITATDSNSSKTKSATYTIKVNKATPTLNATTPQALTYPNASTIDYTYDGDGTVSCQTSSSTYVTCSVNTSTKKLTLTPVKPTSSAVTVTLKAAAGTNYNAASDKAISVTVAKGTLTATVTPYSSAYDTSTHYAKIKVTKSDWDGATIVSGTSSSYGNTVTSSGVYNTDYNLSPGYSTVASARTIYYKVTGGTYYADLTGTTTVTISKSATTTTASNVSQNYTGNPIVGSASAKLNSNNSTISGASFTYTYYNGNSCSGTALSGAPTDYRDGGYSYKATLTGTDNYNTSTSSCATLVINKVNATCPTLSNYNAKYDGNTHTIGVTGSASGGTLQYRTSSTGSWSNTNPALGPNAGTDTTVYVQVAGDNNHNTVQCYVSGTTSPKVTITKADASCSITSTPTLTYPSSKTGNIVYSCSGDGALSVTSSDTTAITVGTIGATSTPLTAQKVGSSTISVSRAAGTNYNAASAKTTTVSATGSILAITLNKQNGTGGVDTVYEKYGSGYYKDSSASTQMTTSSNAITVPTRDGYTFVGYFTTESGGTQYIGSDGKLSSSASNTNFTAAGNLYAHWTKAASSLTVTLGTSSYTYDGNAKTPTVTVKDGTTTLSEGTAASGKDYALSYSNNINAGTAKATITGNGVYNTTTKAFYVDTKDTTFTINKRKVTVTAPTVNSNTLTYNGSAKTIAGTTGTCSAGGTMYYYTNSYTSSSAPTFSTSDGKWSTTYPSSASGTNAGTYYMWYYCQVTDTDNNEANSGSSINTALSVTKTIERATVDEPSCTAATYNSSSQTLLAAKTSGAYTNEAITGITAGSYSKTLTLNSNYKWSSGSNVTSNRTKTCSISKKDLTITAKAQSITYGQSISTGTSQVTTATLQGSDSLTAITLTPSTSSATTTGTITPSAATIKRGTEDVTSSYNITAYNTGNLTIAQREVVVTKPTANSTTLTYNGSDQNLLSTAGTCSAGGTMYYWSSNPSKTQTTAPTFSTSSGWTTTAPTSTSYKGTDAGTYYMWYYCYVSDTTNNKAASGSTINTAQSITKTIGKATPVITLSQTSSQVFMIEAGGTTSVTATVKSGSTASAAGTLAVSSSNSNVFTVSPTSSSKTATTSGVTQNITITGVAGGSANYTVNFTPTDTTNFNSATAQTRSGGVANKVTIETIIDDSTLYYISNHIVKLYQSGTAKYTLTTSGNRATTIDVDAGTYDVWATKSTTDSTLVDTGVDVTITTTSGVTSNASGTINYYTLTLNKDANVTTVTGAGAYLSNQTASINATEFASGYVFNNWTKTEGNNPADANSASTTVSMSAKTTLTANAKLNIICKRPTTLHTEICQKNSTSQTCGAVEGYDNTIVYGNLGASSSTLNTGDAFVCDVNGDGTYNETNEMFYYVSDYYDTSTKTTNSSYAALIYYINTVDGNVMESTVHAPYNQASSNKSGPVTGVTHLPTTSSWNNISLYKTNRQILTETNTTSTPEGSLPVFSYEGKAARLLTYQEVYNGCYDGSTAITSNTGLHNCNFLFENTYYNQTNYVGHWLETPVASVAERVYNIDSDSVNVTKFTSEEPSMGIRPTIDILKTSIDKTLRKAGIFYSPNGGTGTMSPKYVNPNTSTTLDTNTYTKSGYLFDGWNTKPDGSGTSYSNGQSITATNILKLYAQWRVATGLVWEGNDLYYYLNGVKQSGWQEVDGDWYYFDTSTKAAKSEWFQSPDSNRWYYFDPDNRKMLTGVQTIDGDRYYFYTPEPYTEASNKGQMAYNEFIDGYWYNSSGEWDGKQQAVWKQSTNGWYYAYLDDSWIANNTSYWIDGRQYTFNSNGYWIVNVTFNKNGGTGSMADQSIPANISTALRSNTFTNSGYTFSGWNTKANGSGTSYSNSQAVTISNDLTLYAQWEEGPKKCKRATAAQLHTETCSQSSNYCGAVEGNGNTITYGSAGTSGTLATGDAFICDVNGDETYDDANEMFYYVSDYYDTSTKTTNSNYAVLVYSANFKSGSAVSATTAGSAYYSTSNKNNMGPVTAATHLPTTSTWSNVSLYKTSRAILNESAGTSTGAGALPTAFSYSGKAARLLTYQEINNGCYDGTAITSTGSLVSKCKFLFEKTKYSSSSNSTYGPWLETPRNSGSNYAYCAYSSSRNIANTTITTTTRGVRPAIEVLKTDMEITSATQTVTFNANGGTGTMSNQTVPKGVSTPLTANAFTRSGYIFNGWNTQADGTGTSYTNGQLVSLTSNLTLYAQWMQNTGTTITYNANGGKFSNNATTKAITYTQSSSSQTTKYSYTSNVSSSGAKQSEYGNDWNEANIVGTDRGSTSNAHVITISGASSVTVDIYYNTEPQYDWVCIWSGSHPTYTAEANCSSSDDGYKAKLQGNQTGTYTVNGNTLTKMGHQQYTILGDTVTFGFFADEVNEDGDDYYGYYAMVSGTGSEPVIIPSTSYEQPTRSGYDFVGWYTTTSYTTEFTLDSNNIPTNISSSRTVYAKWEQASTYKCKRVTSAANLHTETCSQSSSNSCNVVEGNGNTITYGKAKSLGTALEPGDAFDCKVSTSGGYTERFYYVGDYFDVANSTEESFVRNSDYAVLVYYTNTINGVASTSGAAYDSSGNNWYGPRTALTHLPTTSQWNNISLYNSTRKITNANLGATTSGGTLPTAFSYSGKAARLLSFEMIDCFEQSASTCNFLLENTKYSSSSYATYSPWMENPDEASSNKAFYISIESSGVYGDFKDVNSTNYGVRPVIEVQKSKLQY